VTRGQIYEQLVPYSPGVRFNPKDAQFFGRPLDFVVFDGPTRTSTGGSVACTWHIFHLSLR
jgi:predicted Holliday junction resolvase-like endonuclease